MNEGNFDQTALDDRRNQLLATLQQLGIPAPTDEEMQQGGFNVLERLAYAAQRVQELGIDPKTAYTEYVSLARPTEGQKTEGAQPNLPINFPAFVDVCEAAVTYNRYLTTKSTAAHGITTDPLPYLRHATNLLRGLGYYRNGEAEKQADFDAFNKISPSLVGTIVRPYQGNTYRTMIARNNIIKDPRGEIKIVPKSSPTTPRV